MAKIVTVDFDGTLVEFDYYNPPDCLGKVIWDNKPKYNLERLKDNDFIIIIYTCRSDTKPVEKILNKHKIPFDYVNENPFQSVLVADCKIRADYYIDNSNACYENLTKSVDMILKKEKELKKKHGGF